MKQSEPCALCGAHRKLELSHIIPQFVYRWAKTASGTEDIQTGLTRAMLCGDCEDRFSFFESEFASKVFHPFAAKAVLSAKYDAWLRKFAASVCWRILEERIATKPGGPVAECWTAERASCHETWRQYLLGKRPDVGGHHLHLLTENSFVARESEVGPALQPSPGLWLTSVAVPRMARPTIASDIVYADHAAFVYAKLGPFVLIGLIADSAPKNWLGTRINAEGKLKPREISVPDYCRTYIGSQLRRHNSGGN